MDSDEGRVARRLFRDSSHFEKFMNTVLFRANINKVVYIDQPAKGWWETRMAYGFLDVRHEVEVALRVGASLAIQPEQRDIFGFYLPACMDILGAKSPRSSCIGRRAVSSETEWKRMARGSADYFAQALSGFRSLNCFVIQYVNDAQDIGIDPQYLHDVSDDHEVGVFTALYTHSQIETLHAAGVPATYARDLRFAERTFSVDPEDIIAIYRAGVPIGYVVSCIQNGVYPHRLLRLWEEGIPVEYAALV